MTQSIYSIPVKTIAGKEGDLSPYKGKVLLIVNVASKCGLTPQYKSLEAFYKKHHQAGFEILGFPANNFKEQEPGSDKEITEFCTLNYGVTFPMFSKVSVKGADQHPLYAYLTRSITKSTGEGPFREKLKGYGIEGGDPVDVLWNFEKFLVGKDGHVIARFSPDVTADDPRIEEAVEKALKA